MQYNSLQSNRIEMTTKNSERNFYLTFKRQVCFAQRSQKEHY